MMGGRIIDLSHTLIPGREENWLEIDTRSVENWEQFSKYPGIDETWYIISGVTLSTPSGTHIEFPYHHVKEGQDAATLPLENLVGPGVVVDVSEWGDGQEITLEDLKRAAGGRIQPADILYCHTGCHRFYRTENRHRRPWFSTGAIKWLITEARIKVLGVDASGIEPPGPDGTPYPGQPNHEALLEAGIPLIEYMTNLETLINKRFLTFVLPLKLAGAEAFPVRVIAAETIRAQVPASFHLPSHRISLTRVRKIVADRMADSARLIPQFSVSIDVDAGQLLARRKEFQRRAEADGVQVTLTALLTYLVARALQRYPLLNARSDGDGVVVYKTFNIGVAVATSQGLMVPVLHQVQTKNVIEIARQLTEITTAAREGRLSPADLADGTFTISNLGVFGVGQFVPLVDPPQSAILGVGAARAAVMPAGDGTVRPTQRMNLTVSGDHRVLDGEAIAQFLQTLGEQVEGCEIDTHGDPCISGDLP